jgi:O-antigen ligase
MPDVFSPERYHLPREKSARWASIFFSLSILTLLFSLAASQAFLAAAGVAYAVHLFRNRPRVAFPPIKLPLAIFIGWTVLSMFWANNPAAGGLQVRKLVLFVILVLAVNLIIGLKHLETLCRVMFFEAAIAGLVGAAQFARQYHAVHAEHPHHIYFYMTLQRIRGFTGHWVYFGGQQMLVFVMLLAYLLLAPRVRAIGWLIAGVVAFSILLNFTRGAWLGCFVAALYLVARWKPKLLWVVPALVVAVLLASPRMVRERAGSVLHPSEDASISIRFEMWRVGLKMIQKHPWVGVGPNNIDEDYVEYLPPGKSPAPGYHAHLHNDYIQFAATRGLPCLAAWLWMMAALVWHSLKIRKKSAAGRWIVEGAIAAWLAFAVEGCFEFNYGASAVFMMFLFAASTPFIVAQAEASEPPQRDFLISQARRE